MSKPNVEHQKKKQNLGRGLGSLLGGDSGAFSKMTSNSSAAVASVLNDQKPVTQTSDAGLESKETQVIPETQAGTSTHPVQPQVPPESRVWTIPIENIQPNKEQPRKRFEKEALEELSASIKEKGIIQPILLKKIGADKYEIIAGERRWRAAQKAGLQEVPALIKDLEDQEVMELALIENIQRKDLNPIEEAEGYDLLMKRFNLTQQEMADRVGKDRATVANLVRLLQLSPEIRRMILTEEISQGQAKVLLSLGDQKAQMEMALKIKAESLSVRALEKLVAQKKRPEKIETEERPQSAAQMGTLKEELQKLLGSRVDIEYQSGKGKLKLYFYSDDQLNQIIDRLRD